MHMKDFKNKFVLKGTIIYLLLIASSAFSMKPPVESGPGEGIKVYANNFCEFWSRIYISEGVDSLGTSATIGLR